MSLTAIRVTVFGHVQGVGFRWFVMRAARELGIAGWVRNNSDGSVTAHGEGTSGSLTEWEKRLAHGPATAHVTRSERTSAPPESATDFVIRG